jgi:hypothetical protein
MRCGNWGKYEENFLFSQYCVSCNNPSLGWGIATGHVSVFSQSLTMILLAHEYASTPKLWLLAVFVVTFQLGNARRQFGSAFLLGEDGVLAIWLKAVFSVSGRELRYTNLRMPPSGD